ncbi:MAG: hypothetical protein R2911_26960 [Caldilineaceae bacterium]
MLKRCAACAIGAGAARPGLSTERTVAILSGNSLEHQLLSLAAMHVGIPCAHLAALFAALQRFWQIAPHAGTDDAGADLCAGWRAVRAGADCGAAD